MKNDVCRAMVNRKVVSREATHQIRRYYELQEKGTSNLSLFEIAVNRLLSSGNYRPNAMVRRLYDLADDLWIYRRDRPGPELDLTKAYGVRGMCPKTKVLITERLAEVYIACGRSDKARGVIQKTLKMLGQEHAELAAPLRSMI